MATDSNTSTGAVTKRTRRSLWCRMGLHRWSWDAEAGASGHSMTEAIAFLYCNLHRCTRGACDATKWVRKP